MLVVLSAVGIPLLTAQTGNNALLPGHGSGGWSSKQYYPGLNQAKIEVFGSDVTMPEKGPVVLSNLVIKNFAVTGGEPGSIIEAPQCFYDLQQGSAYSTGALNVRANEGRLLFDGVGFRYDSTNSLLNVSNRVHTIVYQEDSPHGKNARTNAGPTQIFSDVLNYAMKTGRTIYRGHARILDPRMNLLAEILTAQLPPEGSKATHIDSFVAERHVLIDFIDENRNTNHGSGEKAVYTYKATTSATNEFLELSGNPRLDITNNVMTADLFTYDRQQEKFRGIGHFMMHSLGQTQSTAPGETNSRPVETVIRSGLFDFESGSGLASFQDQVRLRDPRLELDSEKLLARLPPGGHKTNFSQRIDAETNVVLNFIDKDGRTQAGADRAIYTYLELTNSVRTNEVLQLLGNPILERTNAWTKADKITMDRSAGRLYAHGHHHSVIKSSLGPARPGQPAPTVTTNALGTSDTEIFSDNAEFRTESSEAYFDGTVHVFDPRFTLSSAVLTAVLPPRGSANSHLQHVDAENHVVIDFIDARGATNHATADKSIYDYKVAGTVTNEVLKLIGHPLLIINGLPNSAEDGIDYNITTGGITGHGRPNLNFAPGRTNSPPPPNPVGK